MFVATDYAIAMLFSQRNVSVPFRAQFDLFYLRIETDLDEIYYAFRNLFAPSLFVVVF